MKPNFQKIGRRLKNTGKRVGTIVRKGASFVRTIMGTIDNATGGALSRTISADPRGAMILGQVNRLADKDAERKQRGLS